MTSFGVNDSAVSELRSGTVCAYTTARVNELFFMN